MPSLSRSRLRPAVPRRQAARAAARPVSPADLGEENLKLRGNQAAVEAFQQQKDATLAAPGSGIRTVGMKGSQAAELGPAGLKPDQAFMGGVGAEKLGEPVGQGAEIAGGLLGGGMDAAQGMKDLLGLAAGGAGLIPGRGPDLSAGPGGILGNRGPGSVTGGLFDPFAGQGKTPLGEGAGIGADPRVASGNGDWESHMREAAGQQSPGSAAADLTDIGAELMAAIPDQGSDLLNAIARVSVSQQTGAQASAEDEKLVADAASDLAEPIILSQSSGSGEGEGGEQDSGSTGDDTQKTDQSTPTPEGGDGSIAGSPKQQAEFKTWMALMTAQQHHRGALGPESLMGDTREAGSARPMAAAEALQQAAALPNRLAPWIQNEGEDVDLGVGGKEVVPMADNTLVDPVRGTEAPKKDGPKPK